MSPPPKRHHGDLRQWIPSGSLLALVLWLTTVAPAAGQRPEGWQRLELPATGSYAEWYVPPDLDLARPVPLVVFLHGSGGTPEVYEPFVEPAADLAGCALLLPKSLSSLGWGFGNDDETLRQAVQLLGRQIRIDRRHTALAGHSAGGAYALQRAYLASGNWSAVFSMSSPFTNIGGFADGEHTAPLRMYYGTTDPNYTGTSYSRLRDQWLALGLAFEEDIRPGFGHSNWPLESMVQGFEFLLGEAYEPAAEPLGCRRDKTPAASLLVPWVEVDMARLDGRTTLVSIDNTEDTPALARLTLWSDCGLPLLAFDLYLAPRETRPLNLRDVIVNGQLPLSAPSTHAPFPDCSIPLELPLLNDAALATLQAQLSGQPDPGDGLCRGSDRGQPNLATGYLTIDSVRRCASSALDPTQGGYFARASGDGSDGLADFRNVLAAEVFYAESAEDSAQGIDAIALPAAGDRFTTWGFPSFYGGDRGDRRLPLGSRPTARFLSGGAFDGGTDLLLWTAGRTAAPFACAATCPGSEQWILRWTEHAESGQAVSQGELPAGPFVRRIAVGSNALAVEGTAGSLLLEVLQTAAAGAPADHLRRQAVAIPIFSAEGRYSVATSALAGDDLCLDGVLAP